MNPLIKWPGGKSGEISKIQKYIPEFKRYIEPFFGGGAMYFHLEPKKAVINDISKNLIDFYILIKNQDTALHELLLSYNNSFVNLIHICRDKYEDILDLYLKYSSGLVKGSELENKITGLYFSMKEEIFLGFDEKLSPDENAFRNHIISMVTDKIKRTVKNDAKMKFDDIDLKENLITGFASGYYMYFRSVYNKIMLGKLRNESLQYRIANFCFIREYCYGSMFRYNKKGEFNIPYGGMTYNKKNFKAKIDNMYNENVKNIFKETDIFCDDFENFLNKIDLNNDDFMFLDPPYDTEFSDYEGNSFTKKDQKRLANVLNKTPAKFILIIKNTDFIYSLYENKFNILSFDNRFTYNVRSRNNRDVKYLLITNLPV